SAADCRELVAIGIADVGGVEIRRVLWPQPGRTLRGSAVRQRPRVKRLHLFPRARTEGDHGAVAGARRAPIERPAQPERQLRCPIALIRAPASPPGGLPTGPRLAAAVTERTEHRIVEARCALRIARAEADVGEQPVARRVSDATGSRARCGARASRK